MRKKTDLFNYLNRVFGVTITMIDKKTAMMDFTDMNFCDLPQMFVHFNGTAKGFVKSFGKLADGFDTEKYVDNKVTKNTTYHEIAVLVRRAEDDAANLHNIKHYAEEWFED